MASKDWTQKTTVPQSPRSVIVEQAFHPPTSIMPNTEDKFPGTRLECKSERVSRGVENAGESYSPESDEATSHVASELRYYRPT
jgi:hypothetical protein